MTPKPTQRPATAGRRETARKGRMQGRAQARPVAPGGPGDEVFYWLLNVGGKAPTPKRKEPKRGEILRSVCSLPVRKGAGRPEAGETPALRNEAGRGRRDAGATKWPEAGETPALRNDGGKETAVRNKGARK